MEKKYRIKEYNGEFTIEIFCSETIGMWWWKKTKSGWYNTNILGSRHIYYIGSPIISKTFMSISEAHKQIQIWKKGPTYHYINN